MLIERPNLHDKIEFDVATTSYRFDMDSHLDATIGDLLTAEERRALSAEFLQQTRSCVLGAEEGTIDFAYSKLAKLPEIRLDALDTDMRQLRFLLESCERFGTIPFAILARPVHRRIDAEVAAEPRHSLEQDEGRFLQSVETVATDFVDDISAVQKGDKTSAEFLEKFGICGPEPTISSRRGTTPFSRAGSLRARRNPRRSTHSRSATTRSGTSMTSWPDRLGRDGCSAAV